MSKLASLHTVLALAALAGSGARFGDDRYAHREWCARCQARGKHRILTQSVTGARYCHGCGYFEKKDAP